VRRLVEMHGGKIVASSKGIGLGSEFEIRLPVVSEVVAPASETEKKPLQRVKSLSLILAEDNRDTAQTMATLLRKLGHEVEVLHDGVGVLETAQVRKPDALLLDIGLPGLNGYEIAERVRQNPELSG